MAATKRFSSALRPYVRNKIEQLESCDIVVGVPSYQTGDSIVHVIETIIKGLDRYYPKMKALLVVSDGGSTDDTRDTAVLGDPKSFNIEKHRHHLSGHPGQGLRPAGRFRGGDLPQAQGRGGVRLGPGLHHPGMDQERPRAGLRRV